MRKVFIDCGTNMGQGYEALIGQLPDKDEFEVHMFEPNPTTFKIVQEKYGQHNLYQKAVHNENTTRHLTLEFDPSAGVEDWVGGATNIMEDVFKKPDYIKDEYIKHKNMVVECIDLSEWIQQNFDFRDTILLKLDIEGSEYEILDKMISDGTIDYINGIVVEWHGHLRSDEVKHPNYYVNIFNQKGIRYTQWY